MTAVLTGTIIPRQPKLEIGIVNLQSSDVPANSVVKIDTGNDPATQFAATPGAVGLAVLVSSAGSYPVGVTIDDMPAGAQGRMQIGGFMYAVASGARRGAGARPCRHLARTRSARTRQASAWPDTCAEARISAQRVALPR